MCEIRRSRRHRPEYPRTNQVNPWLAQRKIILNNWEDKIALIFSFDQMDLHHYDEDSIKPKHRYIIYFATTWKRGSQV